VQWPLQRSMLYASTHMRRTARLDPWHTASKRYQRTKSMEAMKDLAGVALLVQAYCSLVLSCMRRSQVSEHHVSDERCVG